VTKEGEAGNTGREEQVVNRGSKEKTGGQEKGEWRKGKIRGGNLAPMVISISQHL